VKSIHARHSKSCLLILFCVDGPQAIGHCSESCSKIPMCQAQMKASHQHIGGLSFASQFRETLRNATSVSRYSREYQSSSHLRYPRASLCSPYWLTSIPTTEEQRSIRDCSAQRHLPASSEEITLLPPSAGNGFATPGENGFTTVSRYSGCDDQV